MLEDKLPAATNAGENAKFEKNQLLLLIFLRPRSVTGNLGLECKYRVLGPDYSINPPEYKSFKAFCEPFDLSLSYVKTSCQLPLQHLVPLRYPRMSAKSLFWPTVALVVAIFMAYENGDNKDQLRDDASKACWLNKSL